MRHLLIITLCIGIIGCGKDSATRYEAYLINNTAIHSINVTFYKTGLPNSIILNPGDSLKIANGIDLGESSQGFTSEYFGTPNDSIRVTFDNQYTITHYFNTPPTIYYKHYLYTSLRNIGNVNSYTIQRRGNMTSHFYYFMEQDFLDAK